MVSAFQEPKTKSSTHLFYSSIVLQVLSRDAVTLMAHWWERWVRFQHGSLFSKAPKSFCTRKVVAKSQTLSLHSCLIDIFLIWTEVPFKQEVSGVYTSPFFRYRCVLRARIVYGAFEKQAPGAIYGLSLLLVLAWLRGFFSGFSSFSPSTKTNSTRTEGPQAYMYRHRRFFFFGGGEGGSCDDLLTEKFAQCVNVWVFKSRCKRIQITWKTKCSHFKLPHCVV